MVRNSSGKVKPDIDGISCQEYQLETAKLKMKFWSGLLTTISCLTLIISITIAGVVYGRLSYYLYYLMPGAYGSFFGIIAGPLGICASNAKQLSRTKCLWISHIALVS